MANKFAEFLGKNKIDERRLMLASYAIERLRPEDRRLRLARRNGKADSTNKDSSEAGKKPRSGRPITPRLLREAKQGSKLSGAQKTRLVRAVNRILEQKKAKPVDWRTLF